MSLIFLPFLCNDVNKNLTRSNSYLCAHACVNYVYTRWCYILSIAAAVDPRATNRILVYCRVIGTRASGSPRADVCYRDTQCEHIMFYVPHTHTNRRRRRSKEDCNMQQPLIGNRFLMNLITCMRHRQPLSS